jgi:hypothetical protein
MKNRPQTLVLCVLVAGAASLAAPWSLLAQPQGNPPAKEGSRPPEGRGPGERGPETPGQEGRGGRPRPEQPSVEGAMKGMNRGLKNLLAQVGDPTKKDDNLKIVNDMQRACVGAKSQPVPKDVLEKAGDAKAQAKVSAAYRTYLIKTMRTLLDLEEAIVSDNNDVAKAKVAEIEKLRDAGHDAVGLSDEEPELLPRPAPK